VSHANPQAAVSPAVAARPTPSLRKPPAPPAPGLDRDLSDPDPKIRRAAVREASDPQQLLAASRDPDTEVGVVAMERLGRLHADGEVSTRDLIARATDHQLNERVRVSALDGLGQVADRDAAATLA